MTEPAIDNVEPSGASSVEPVALLLCADLMFAVQLQNIARTEGYRPLTLRPGATLPAAAAVLVVNLADLGRTPTWESPVREAAARQIPVIAFGPHIDTDLRRSAKEAGASRVLANSNLTRDLPVILRSLQENRTQAEL